jgi:aminoglycoside phosphotransferase (APT) family kinase protein
MSELIPVREEHQFDLQALRSFMNAEVEGARGPIDVQQFEGGQSNPTFLVRSAEQTYVVRKKPPGKLLPSAHAVDREYRVMRALVQTAVPVPRTYALCEDEEVIGTAFFVMEYVEGRIIRDMRLPDFDRAQRTALFDSMNETMARLHSVDPSEVGLESFGRAGNYFARQVSRWSKQYRSSKTQEIEPMERLMAWLEASLPEDDSSGIVHGDFRLQNMIVHPTEPHIVAVLDWELSTLGHPLADLAYNCMGYHIRIPTFSDLLGLDHESTGIPSESDYLETYCQRTGRETISNWGFYVAFALFRIAAIAQGVYARSLQGNASSVRAQTFGQIVPLIAQQAWAIADGDLAS